MLRLSNKRSVSQCETGLASPPFIAGCRVQRSRQAQAGRFIRKDARHASAPCLIIR